MLQWRLLPKNLNIPSNLPYKARVLGGVLALQELKSSGSFSISLTSLNTSPWFSRMLKTPAPRNSSCDGRQAEMVSSGRLCDSNGTLVQVVLPEKLRTTPSNCPRS